MADLAVVWNAAAYMAQIACVTLLAELVLRAVPVRSAPFRYAYWRIVLVAALGLPWAFRAAVPAAAREAAVPTLALFPAPAEYLAPGAAAAVTASSGAAWLPLLLAVAAAGVAARLLWLAAGIRRLRALRRRGETIREPAYDDLQGALGTRVELRCVPGLAQPATFGLRRPVVLLPAALASLSEPRRRAVVAHELVHVRHRDWAWVCAEELLRAALWFHPAIWWLVSRVQLTREEFTDHVAVLATGSRRDYMEALLAFADMPAARPAPAFARRAHLFHRIVLLSRREAPMTSRRIGFSVALPAMLLLGGAWYSSEAFPLRPAAGGVMAAARQASQPVNIVTPENPIPRRVVGSAVPYPLELAGTSIAATVWMALVLEGNGSVTPGSISVNLLGTQPESDIERQRLVEAFTSAATTAVTAWQYESPAQAPLGFAVRLQFRPGQPTVVAQETPGAGIVPGASGAAGAARAGSLQDTITVGRASSARTGSGLFAKTRHVDPVYPEAAKAAGVGGVVILEATIDERGRVANPRILRSIPVFDQAVLDAVRQWEFVPTLVNGVPASVPVTWTVMFSAE